MKIAIFGDLHGFTKPPIRFIETFEPDICLQTGDYFAYEQKWPVPFYWIFGNHEDINYPKPLPRNSFQLTGGVHNINGLNIMALPGLPQKRQTAGPAGFSQEDYEKCLSATEIIDIFISHGAGFPFKRFRGIKFQNLEEKAITLLLQQHKPRIAASGHNHEYELIEYEGITCIRLDCVLHNNDRRLSGFAHLLEL